MPKSTVTYWNPLQPEHAGQWRLVAGLEGMADELTLSIDTGTGEYTRLTRFHPGAKSHDYPEEIFIVSGRLYDAAFDLWLTAGHYASRPPGEVHGPFRTDTGCLVLEMSFPGRARAGLSGAPCRTGGERPAADRPDTAPAAPTVPGPAQ